MAVYYNIRCPHCNRIVETGKDRSKQYGSPIRMCRHCAHNYLDDNYAEAALFSEKEVKKRKFSWQAVFLVLIGGIALFGGIAELIIWWIVVGAVLAGLGLFSIISDLKYNPQNDKIFQLELRESKKRLSDPRYVIALWELGYPIPPQMFNEAKEILNYKTKSEIYQEKMQSDDYDEGRYICKSVKFLSDVGEGKCTMCFQKSTLKKYRIKTEVGTREIPICDNCIARFNRHNIFE